MAKRIGLTGGIASGKTYAAGFLSSLGALVLDADSIARDLVLPGTPNLLQITGHFGPSILLQDGTLDRARLRATILADPKARKWLEALLHPQIRQRLLELSRELEARHPQATILWVIPLLVEGHYQPLLDGTLLIDCSRQIQEARLQKRDGWTPEQIRVMIDAQSHPETRRISAQWIISNRRSPEELHRQLQQWWEHLEDS